VAQKRKPSTKKPAAKRPQRKNQPSRRSRPLRRFSSVLKERCPRSAAHATRGCRQTKGLRFFTPADLQDPKYSYLFLPTPRQAQPDLGGGLTPINTILPAVGITTTRQGNSCSVRLRASRTLQMGAQPMRGRLTGVRTFRRGAWRIGLRD
jgi:hypothetical protein